MGEKFTFKRCEIKIMILLKFSQKRRHYTNTTYTHNLYSAQHSTHYSRHLCLSKNPTNLFYPATSIFRPSRSQKKVCTHFLYYNELLLFSLLIQYPQMQNFPKLNSTMLFLSSNKCHRKKSLWTIYRSKNNK